MFSGFGDENSLSIEEAVKQAVHRVDPYGLMLARRRKASGTGGGENGAHGTAEEDPDPYIHLIVSLARRIKQGEFLSPAMVQDALLRMEGREEDRLPDPEDVRELTRQIGVGLGFA